MAWMNRQDNSGGVQGDYLNAADTATRPMAIASLLLTLVLISAIALMLFSAGRWAYNRFNQNDATVATTSENQVTEDSQQTNTSQQPATPAEESDTPSSTPENTPANTSDTSSQQANTAQSAQTQDTNALASPTTGASTPEVVPNTGSGSTLGYFAAASVLATLIAYGWQLKRIRL